jgi:hypothetical protein
MIFFHYEHVTIGVFGQQFFGTLFFENVYK